MTSFEVRRSQQDDLVSLLSRLPEQTINRMTHVPEQMRSAALSLRSNTPVAERRDFVEVRSGFYSYSARKTQNVRSTETKPVAVSEDERLAAHRKVQAAIIASLR